VWQPKRKHALDSNVFIRAYRSEVHNGELQSLHRVLAPFEYLSAIVVFELRVGIRSRQSVTTLEQNVFEPFERRGRVFAPSYATWKRAGEALAQLAWEERRALQDFGRSFVNDVLLAASCRETGIVLVTENERDFTRISRVIPFEFVPAWQ
jgi:predicted nucleic acid-binding protein